MSIKIDGKDYRIGLALSGGGFRATAFHLGVFRKLREMGILWKLDLLSCVSGGSIAGAYLAANWGDDAALDRLDKYLRSTSIAVVVGGGGDARTRSSRGSTSWPRPTTVICSREDARSARQAGRACT